MNNKSLQEYFAGFFPALGFFEINPDEIEQSKVLLAGLISLATQILLRVINHWIDKKFRQKDNPNPNQ